MSNQKVRRWTAFILTALFVLTFAFQGGISVRAGDSTPSAIPESNDLKKFLTDVSFAGPVAGEDGTLTVEDGKAYDVYFSFAEGEKLQFAGADLVYDIPKDITLTVPPDGETFTANLTDREGTVSITGNTCWIKEGKLYVHTNTSDPNYGRLRKAANVKFT